MRITTRLSTAGQSSGFLSMPTLRNTASSYMLEPRVLDEAKVRTELAGHCGITMSSDDDRDTLSFAVELLDRMKTAMQKLVGEKDSGVRIQAKNAPKTTAEKRFDHGKFAFVRVDIRRNGGGGFRILLSATDPKECVGHAREFAEIYAQNFADNIVAIAIALEDEHVPVVLIEKEGCNGVFAFARRRIAFLAAKERHEGCKNRCGCHCSPSNPICELYNRKNGHCRFDDSLEKDGSDGWTETPQSGTEQAKGE